jgi:acetyl esterase/lipase
MDSRNVLRLAVVVLATAGAAACGSGSSAPVYTPEPPVTFAPLPGEPLAIEVSKDQPYTSERSLDVYAPAEAGPWPVVVMLHGGSLTKTSLRGLSQAVAGRGVVVFTPTWHSNVPSADAVALGWEDAACAVRFARANAATYGGSSSRLIVVGHSAGGPAAAVIALGGEALLGDCLVDGVSARADGMVGLDGAYDILSFIPATTLDAAPAKEWARIDPFAYLKATQAEPGVEFLLFVGLEDELMQNAEKLKDGLEAAGYPVSLTRLSGVDHMDMASVHDETVSAIVDLARGP